MADEFDAIAQTLLLGAEPRVLSVETIASAFRAAWQARRCETCQHWTGGPLMSADPIPETDFLKLKIEIHRGWRRDPDDGNLTAESYEFIKQLMPHEAKAINTALEAAAVQAERIKKALEAMNDMARDAEQRLDVVDAILRGDQS